MDFGKPILLIMCFIWIRVIYFYFVFIEDQSFKTHVQSMWNSNTPVISIKLLYNPSQFLDQGFMLCFDQIRPSANINGEVSLLFDYLQFLLFEKPEFRSRSIYKQFRFALSLLNYRLSAGGLSFFGLQVLRFYYPA